MAMNFRHRRAEEPEINLIPFIDVRILDRAVDVEGGEIPETQNKVMLMPGFPCPLCRFPTYTWVEDLETKLETYILDFIRENHPGWDVEYGACDRCVEVYKLRADGVM